MFLQENLVDSEIYVELCDKLHVFATEKISRRVKDIYDIYIFSNLSFLSKSEILRIWKQIGYKISVPLFGLSMNNYERFRKPYDNLTDELFDGKKLCQVYGRVSDFVTDLYIEILGGNTVGNIWSVEKGVGYDLW